MIGVDTCISLIFLSCYLLTYHMYLMCPLPQLHIHAAVKLVKEIVSAGQTALPEGTIYSIALLQDGAPTVQSAHEKTKSMLRDMVLGDEQDQAGALDPDLLTDDVQPDERIQELLGRSDYDAMRLKRIAATLPKGVEPDLHGASRTGGGSQSMAAKKKAAPARKTTSAASFFGASAASASASGSSKGGTSTAGGSSKPPKPTNKLGFASASATSSTVAKKKTSDTGKENSENEDVMEIDAPIAKKKKASAASPKDKKKKQQQQSSGKSKSPNRGNVDDFVGDEDEDEDFIESEAQRKARKAKDAKAAEDKLAEQKKKQAPAGRRKVIQDDDDDDDGMDVDDKEKKEVYGEMDFHFNKGGDEDAKTGGGKKEKKKRKKLVEKTSMDDRGFLITEKVWVEEDIPTDEEDNAEETGPSPTKKLKSGFGTSASASAAAKKKPAAKNTKGMKQAGLGAFFGAKKK